MTGMCVTSNWFTYFCEFHYQYTIASMVFFIGFRANDGGVLLLVSYCSVYMIC